MTYRYETDKFDWERADAAGTVEEVVLSQYPEWDGEEVRSSSLFMPEDEQEKMREYVQERFGYSDKDMGFIYLEIFPSAVEWERKGCECPRMDNRDAGAFMYINTGCPIHKCMYEERRRNR